MPKADSGESPDRIAAKITSFETSTIGPYIARVPSNREVRTFSNDFELDGHSSGQ